MTKTTRAQTAVWLLSSQLERGQHECDVKLAAKFHMKLEQKRNQEPELWDQILRTLPWQHEWFHAVTYKLNSILSESKCFISLGLSWPIFFEGWIVLKFPKESLHIFEWVMYLLLDNTHQTKLPMTWVKHLTFLTSWRNNEFTDTRAWEWSILSLCINLSDY